MAASTREEVVVGWLLERQAWKVVPAKKTMAERPSKG